MKTHILCFICIMASMALHAQNTLQGQVINKTNNESLSFVNIYFPELEQGSTTDEAGNFSISNLPNGNFKIIFSFIGFETLSMSITLPTEEVLNVGLSPSAIEIEEVILSTPFHKLQSENVMKVEREKVSDLISSGATNLSQGISNIAGVESISTGNSIGKPVIRGLSGNRVLVYTQGIRLENQQFGDEHGLGISGSGIESVEVIKGPASLLYGSDALGGVLYLNPERFAPENSRSADGSFDYYTNTRGYNTNLGFKSSSDAFKLIFRSALSEHADYKADDLRITNSRYKEQDFKAGIGYQKNVFKTEFRYNLNASQIGLPEEIGIQSTSTDPLLPSQSINNHIFSSKSKIFLNKSSIDLNFGFSYNDRKEFEDHHDEHEDEEEEEVGHEEEESEEASLHMKLKTFNYDLKYNLPDFGIVETIVGVQGMFQTNSNFGEEELIPDANTSDIGILATSHIHFDKVDIQLGLRFDSRTIEVKDAFDRSFNSFNAALGARTNLMENLVARLNFASGFRAPNLAELSSDGIHHGTNRYEIGNPNLDNEQNFQTDVSLEYKSEHFEVFANGFYNHLNNYIFVEPNGEFIEGDPVYNYLQDNANLFGGEFGFHFHPHPLDWLHIESSFEAVRGERDGENYLPLIPANKLNNIIRVEFNNEWLTEGFGFIKLKTSFEQSKVSEFETPTPSYSLLSAGFGGTVDIFGNAATFRITGNNLTDKVYIDHLSRLKSDGIPNMGRNFSLGIKYKI